MGNPKYIIVRTKMMKKVDQIFYLHFDCSEVLISRFISHINCRNLKKLQKKIKCKTELGCHPQNKRSTYKVLNFEVDFLKTEFFHPYKVLRREKCKYLNKTRTLSLNSFENLKERVRVLWEFFS